MALPVFFGEETNKMGRDGLCRGQYCGMDYLVRSIIKGIVMSPSIRKLRHPKEGLYGGLLKAAGCVFWAALLVLLLVSAFIAPRGIVTIFTVLSYIVMGTVIALIGEALFRAHAMGNMVEVTSSQFPHIHAEIIDVAAALGLAETPRTFIYNSHGVMNAFAMRLFGARYVFLTSAVVEADNDAQLRFIIAHEIAHHVLGHLGRVQRFLAAPGIIIPFLYPAYSRAREYSCDAVGASVVLEVESALTALQMLACGTRRLNGQMNTAAFSAQERNVPQMAGFVMEIVASHPRLTRRVERLKAFFSAGQTPAMGNAT